MKKDELYCLDQRALEFPRKVKIHTLNNENKEEFQDLINFCLEDGIIILRCKHCFVGKGGEVDLPSDKIYKILKDFEELQRLSLIIKGGEPLLHPQFYIQNSLLPKLAFEKSFSQMKSYLETKLQRHL